MTHVPEAFAFADPDADTPRFRLRQLGRSATGIALVGACVLVVTKWAPWIRAAERLVSARIAGAITAGRVAAYPAPDALIITPTHGDRFVGIITKWCSMSVVLAILIGFAALLSMGQRFALTRLARSAMLGVLVLGAANQLRLVGSLWAGVEYGSSQMRWVHDLVGTPISMIGLIAALVLLIKFSVVEPPQPQPASGIALDAETAKI